MLRSTKSKPRPLKIPQKVADALAELTARPDDQFTLDATLIHDLGADSLDLRELAMMLEEAYDVMIPDSVVDRWEPEDVTVGGVIEVLKECGARL